MERLLVGLEEGRRLLGLGRNEFFRLLKRGEIKGRRIGPRGGRWLFPVKELERWAAGDQAGETGKASACGCREERKE